MKQYFLFTLFRKVQSLGKNKNQTKLSTSDNLTHMTKNRKAIENELEGVCVLTPVISDVNSVYLYICIVRNHR